MVLLSFLKLKNLNFSRCLFRSSSLSPQAPPSPYIGPSLSPRTPIWNPPTLILFFFLELLIPIDLSLLKFFLFRSFSLFLQTPPTIVLLSFSLSSFWYGPSFFLLELLLLLALVPLSLQALAQAPLTTYPSPYFFLLELFLLLALVLLSISLNSSYFGPLFSLLKLLLLRSFSLFPWAPPTPYFGPCISLLELFLLCSFSFSRAPLVACTSLSFFILKLLLELLLLPTLIFLSLSLRLSELLPTLVLFFFFKLEFKFHQLSIIKKNSLFELLLLWSFFLSPQTPPIVYFGPFLFLLKLLLL